MRKYQTNLTRWAVSTARLRDHRNEPWKAKLQQQNRFMGLSLSARRVCLSAMEEGAA